MGAHQAAYTTKLIPNEPDYNDLFKETRSTQLSTNFSAALTLLGCVYVGLLLGLSQYTSLADDPEGQVNQYYQYLIHVNIMVRIPI